MDELKTNSVKNIDSSKIEVLASQLRGKIIMPNDANYEDTQKVYNAMIDKHPAMFAMCVDVADVIASVNFARENNLLLAVRGGGHNAGGLGICDDGLVVDLSGWFYCNYDYSGTAIS